MDVDTERVEELLREYGCPWPRPEFVSSTGSTNGDLLARIEGGSDAEALAGLCRVAGEQTHGRGRRGRSWSSDRGAGLWCSTIVNGADTWLPLVASLAVVDAVRALTGVDLHIKWPNDVLDHDDRKIAGVLVESRGVMSVIGIGMNLDYRAENLPHPNATSWRLLVGAPPDRNELVAALLESLWRRSSGPRERNLLDYRDGSRTIGTRVRVSLPGGRMISGLATDVDDHGFLVVRQDDGSEQIVVAGDVIHANIG